jgi:membrane protease YdiL (CAAX protease family)
MSLGPLPIDVSGNKEINPLDLAPNRQARGKAMLRFIVFMALAVGATSSALFVTKYVLKISIDVDGPVPMMELLVANFVLAIVNAALPTAIMVGATHESSQTFGWGQSRRWRQLGMGLAAGFGLLSTLLLAMSLLGGYSFGDVTLAPRQAVEYGITYLIIFALTAVSEEGALRGYGLVQLSRAISFWPAAVVMSALFLALHLVHSNETPIGLAQVGLVGLILAYSFRRSGALWFALGFHASWDYAQSFVFGVPDSGTSLTEALLHPTFHGPNWLTGGSAGPEGSVLVLPILAVLAVVTHIAFPASRTVS